MTGTLGADANTSHADGMLGGYRVLDLSGEQGQFCGRLLADLGADVIKVERPGGDRARRLGPFYKDTPHPENSLSWMLFNLGKRGITLDLETADGRSVFRQLLATSHFVVESFAPGYLAGLGLGYEALCALNPGIILASITPFGQDGPYRDYQGGDLVSMAMGGLMATTGRPDQVPLRISLPQSSLLAGETATFATLVAHRHRLNSGEGQHVDTSTQAAVSAMLSNWIPMWQVRHQDTRRLGNFVSARGVNENKQRVIWACKDGHVVFRTMGNTIGGKSNAALVAWMDREGKAPEFLKAVDWLNLDMTKVTQAQQNALEAAFEAFLLEHTRDELLDWAIENQVMLLPSLTPAELTENTHLSARDFWVDVEHPDKSDVLRYPGPFVKASESPVTFRRPAPRIGEHNLEIYEQELGYSRDEVIMLFEAGAI